jgi:hypothetical protein
LKSRPVHIFYGDSNTCKSYIAALTGKAVYETDMVTCIEDVPTPLTQDIIVIGNRWKCEVGDIKERIFGISSDNPPTIIEVSFKK